MKFSQFCDWINVFSGERPKNIRLGQHAFNTLCEFAPGVADRLRASDIDPFHRDDLVPAFLSEILMSYVRMD